MSVMRVQAACFLAVTVALALAAAGCGSTKSTASPAVRAGSAVAYAYVVPVNPAARSGPWATRVSETKLQAGDRFRSSGRLWEVVAVQPTADDGKPAAVRGWPQLSSVIQHPTHKWGNPVWAGKLVLRAAH